MAIKSTSHSIPPFNLILSLNLSFNMYSFPARRLFDKRELRGVAAFFRLLEALTGFKQPSIHAPIHLSTHLCIHASIHLTIQIQTFLDDIHTVLGTDAECLLCGRLCARDFLKSSSCHILIHFHILLSCLFLSLKWLNKLTLLPESTPSSPVSGLPCCQFIKHLSWIQF